MLEIVRVREGMIMPKVSIIVPVYNAENTLVRCLESLVSQTYQDKEIILINDGSTDSSATICDKYSSEYSCIVLINQKNAGPATARNAGINKAKGDYISFVDSDDYIEYNMIESMIRAAENHQAEMVICGYYQEIEGKSYEHKFKYVSGLYEGKDAYKIAVDLIDDVSETRIPPYSWVRMIKRDIFENPTIRYPDGMIRSEDYYFYVQIHFRVKRLYLLVDKPLYHYMEIKGSVTHKYVKYYWKSVKEIYFGLEERLPEQSEIKTRLDVMLVQRSLIALNNSSRANDIRVFKSESYEILRDCTLHMVMKQIPFRNGIKLFGLYYVFMRARVHGLIYGRYLYKFCKK